MSKLKQTWCDWFHGGGTVERDEIGRINWRCHCGRWSDSPVPIDIERKQTDAAIGAAIRARGRHL